MAEWIRDLGRYLILACVAPVAACATVHADPAGYTQAQTDTMETAGFHRVGDNYELGFSNRVLFGFDSSEVKEQTGAMLGELANVLASVGIHSATVEGHTDSQGDAEYNIDLSLQRADSVRILLVAGGMRPDRTRSIGIGEAEPIESNDTEEGRRQNRRVVIVITAPAGADFALVFRRCDAIVRKGRAKASPIPLPARTGRITAATNVNLPVSRGHNMSDTAERVKKIVVEHLGVEEDKVTPDASFIDDLGADSLDIVELVMAFEEEFGVEIPDDAAEKINTVGDANKYIEEHKG